jgi:hypothetical protein
LSCCLKPRLREHQIHEDCVGERDIFLTLCIDRVVWLTAMPFEVVVQLKLLVNV